MILKQDSKRSHTDATYFMAERDMESHGRFLAPFLQSGLNVLDAGCGPGTITNDIAEWVFPGQVTGLDICSDRLRHACRLSQGRELMNTSFIEASADSIPRDEATFDLVFCHDLLEHVSNPEHVMREFRRVLCEGGILAVCSQQESAPNTHSASWLEALGFSILSQGEWNESRKRVRGGAEQVQTWNYTIARKQKGQ